MSTRSAIIQKTEDGYEGIYCHFDGYLSGVGRELLENYQDADKVDDLISLGDISCLYSEVWPNPREHHSFDKPQSGVTIAYGRDRGEEGTDAIVGETIDDVASKIGHNGYVYVYDNGWTCNGKKFTVDED
jgi:hypothetical protein